MPEFVKVAKSSEIAPGEAKAVDVQERRVAIFNVDGTFYAVALVRFLANRATPFRLEYGFRAVPQCAWSATPSPNPNAVSPRTLLRGWRR